MAIPKIGVVVTADTKQAEAGLRRVQSELTQTGAAADTATKRTDAMGATLVKTGGKSSAFGRGLQNASFQLGDFATQVGAGTSASIALGQQLPQLLGGFGILGAVLGAVVAVAVPLTRAFQSMNDQGQDMTVLLGVLSPLAEQLGSAFQSVAAAGVQMAEIVINNLDRILITGGVVAAFFAGKWVAAFVAARVATFSLSAALAGLRAALIRTGFGAVIVLAGELIYQFTKLVKAAGGFGSALGLLADVASEVWERIGNGAYAVELGVQSMSHNVQAAWLNAVATIQEGWAKFVSAVASVALKIPGMEEVGSSLAMSAAVSGQGVSNTRAEADRQSMYGSALGSQSAQLFLNLTAPLESVQKIRDLLASIKDDKITLPDLLGAGANSVDAMGGSKKSPMQEQIDAQIESLEALREQGRATWGALGDFIQQFAGKSKAAAIAAIAIQKGLSIASIIANTAAAQMRALAELGPIAGPPVAAKLGLYGKLQAGLVAATGLAQAASAGGGGGGGGSIGGGGGGAAASTQQAAQGPVQISLAELSGQGFFGDIGGLLTALQDEADARDRGLVFV